MTLPMNVNALKSVRSRWPGDLSWPALRSAIFFSLEMNLRC